MYGAEVKPDAGFRKVALPSQRRSGVITHPLLMAGYAYEATSSPIHRGVFVAKNLLGRRLRPPKEAVTPESPDLHPGLTTRQVIARQTAPKSCTGCHSMINPLGFTLENFDALGRFRVKDKGKAVDASGHYKTIEGKTLQFKGAPELGRFLADSPEAHAAFVQRLFQHTVHQSIHAYGLDRHERLTKNFVNGGYHIRRLLIELIADATLHPRDQRKDGKSS